MKGTRMVGLVVVVAALLALTSWFPGRGAEPGQARLAPGVPVGGAPDDVSATWYCAAGTAGTPEPPGHSLLLANPSGDAATARLTAHGEEGPLGVEDVEVEPTSTLRVPVRRTFGDGVLSVMVESPAAELAVEHRLVAGESADQVPCASASSDRWYFPSLTTTLGSTARLVLFNPFSADAGVDVTAAVEDGLRAPPEWTGIVVPAGTTRVVDVGEHIQRRDQLALSVVLRTGRVVAESVQQLGGEGQPTGLRLQLGLPGASSRWTFAQGFTGEGASERLVVFNPGGEPAPVVVQVTPVGAGALPPEPFELEVLARRYQVIDLSAEGRVPGDGYHAIQVEAGGDTPVVVGRVHALTGAPGEPVDPEIRVRPDVRAGSAIGTGTPVASTRWVVPMVTVGRGEASAVVVHNPGSGIVVVSMAALGGERAAEAVLDEVEVQPGDGRVVRASDLELGGGERGLSVTSSSPVVVERVITFGRSDLSMGLAVPLPSGRDGGFPLVADL